VSVTALEVCAGGGGQYLGLEEAGVESVAVLDKNPDACATMRANRPSLNVIEADLRTFDGTPYKGIDLLAGGVPCTPFSVGGKQLGEDDERHLFPHALRLVYEIRPRIVMLENVGGLGTARFGGFRARVLTGLQSMGYVSTWCLVQSCSYGVPQLRPRLILISVLGDEDYRFRWPRGTTEPTCFLGPALKNMMASNGWEGADVWAEHNARAIAPTIVGGSEKHGGPDLGPTRARAAWLARGVDGKGIANGPPGAGTVLPRLTIAMVARLQGFPDSWVFTGNKTSRYRQVGNAFPPPVARAFGTEIVRYISSHK